MLHPAISELIHTFLLQSTEDHAW